MLRTGLWCLLFMGSGALQAAELAAVTCADRQAARQYIEAAALAVVQRLSGDDVVASLDVVSDLPMLVQSELTVLSKTLRSRMAVKVKGRSCDRGLPVEKTVWLSVRAMRDAWVYGRNARQGSLLSEASPHRERIDMAALQLASSDLPDSLDGQRLIQAAYAGRPVLKQHLTREPWIHRGQQVEVVVRARGLELRMQGTAMQSGAQGDSIAVQVRPEQASMPATIANQGVVHVDTEM